MGTFAGHKFFRLEKKVIVDNEAGADFLPNFVVCLQTRGKMMICLVMLSNGFISSTIECIMNQLAFDSHLANNNADNMDGLVFRKRKKKNSTSTLQQTPIVMFHERHGVSDHRPLECSKVCIIGPL